MQDMTITTAADIERVEAGKRLAADGRVKRVGDAFHVSDPSSTQGIVVRRDQLGVIRCSCDEYRTVSYVQIGFRCEHILAVSYAIALKNTESNSPVTTVESRLPAVEKKSAEAKKDNSKLKATLEAIRLDKRKGEKTMTTVRGTAQSIAAEANNNVVDFSTTLRELRSKVDPQLVRRKETAADIDGNIHVVDYVEWHTVADVLDDTAPNWMHEIKDIRAFGSIVTVTVAITINGISREGVGTGSALSESGIKKAEHDALKRAAVKFGIARDLYKREFDALANDDAPAAEEEAKSLLDEPVAQTMADLVTAKQLGMIRSLARERNIDVDEECTKAMKCRVGDLSKRAASAFIDRLKAMDMREIPIRRAS